MCFDTMELVVVSDTNIAIIDEQAEIHDVFLENVWQFDYLE